MPADYEREVESLHAFFGAWYRGELPSERFARVETALAPSFERVTPDGTIQDRETVLAGVEAARGERTETFEIEIEDLAVIDRTDERALVRYVERQTPGDDRLSAALFDAGTLEPGADGRPSWLYLQETRL
ncbi:hypothetical protein BRC62_02195 [Halobacteriales archaeon QH_10_67_13]|nr:MAG: hypothetical protein BRC62_02195 [Halobacteriales archaeon QH_10_67_13]